MHSISRDSDTLKWWWTRVWFLSHSELPNIAETGSRWSRDEGSLGPAVFNA